jgi:hypothetical protein
MRSDNEYEYDTNEEDELEEEEDMAALAAAAAAITAAFAVINYSNTYYNKTPYHDSALSGAAWVCELLAGHPERIRTELGIHKHVFKALITSLKNAGHKRSKFVTLEEQLAIFLYTCVTGLSLRHVAERFQRATETVSRYVYVNQLSVILIIMSDTFSKCLSSFLLIPSTMITSNFRMKAFLSHRRF